MLIFIGEGMKPLIQGSFDSLKITAARAALNQALIIIEHYSKMKRVEVVLKDLALERGIYLNLKIYRNILLCLAFAGMIASQWVVAFNQKDSWSVPL